MGLSHSFVFSISTCVANFFCVRFQSLQPYPRRAKKISSSISKVKTYFSLDRAKTEIFFVQVVTIRFAICSNWAIGSLNVYKIFGTKANWNRSRQVQIKTSTALCSRTNASLYKEEENN